MLARTHKLPDERRHAARQGCGQRAAALDLAPRPRKERGEETVLHDAFGSGQRLVQRTAALHEDGERVEERHKLQVEAQPTEKREAQKKAVSEKMQPPLAIEKPKRQGQKEKSRKDCDAVLLEETADSEHELRRQGQLHGKTVEHVDEVRQHEEEDERHGEHRRQCEQRRINERRLQFLPHAPALFLLVGETLQQRLQTAARLPRADEGGNRRREHLAVLRHRLGERRAMRHAPRHIRKHRPPLLRRIRREELQALVRGKSRRKHQRQLAAEHHGVLAICRAAAGEMQRRLSPQSHGEKSVRLDEPRRLRARGGFHLASPQVSRFRACRIRKRRQIAASLRASPLY